MKGDPVGFALLVAGAAPTVGAACLRILPHLPSWVAVRPIFNDAYMHFYVLLLLLAAVDRPAGVAAPRRLKLAAAAGLAAGVALVCGSMYVWWSPVGGPLHGVQPRHLLPLLPLMLLAASGGFVQLRIDPRSLAGAAAAASGAYLVMGLTEVWDGFYGRRPGLLPHAAPLTAAALAATAGAALAARWAFTPSAPAEPAPPPPNHLK